MFAFSENEAVNWMKCACLGRRRSDGIRGELGRLQSGQLDVFKKKKRKSPNNQLELNPMRSVIGDKFAAVLISPFQNMSCKNIEKLCSY